MLEIKNLHAQFENTLILKGVNLTVKKGESHVLLGPNGSGKSTLGRVILGDPKYKMTKGEIIMDGKNMTESEPNERALAGFFLSFQAPPEIDGVNVLDFLYAAAKQKNEDKLISRYRFGKKLSEQLQDLRLPDEFLKREFNKGFSGGERKKMEMTSLLTLDSKWAFLDEIDSGVDIDALRKISENIREFLKDKTRSLILITHSEKLFTQLNPTHVHIFTEGKISQSGGKELVDEVIKNGFDFWLKKDKNNGLKMLK